MYCHILNTFLKHLRLVGRKYHIPKYSSISTRYIARKASELIHTQGSRIVYSYRGSDRLSAQGTLRSQFALHRKGTTRTADQMPARDKCRTPPSCKANHT